MRYGIVFLFALFVFAQGAGAQFAPETQTREIHLLKSDQGDTRVIMRFPLMLAYANELAQQQAGSPLVAPFVLKSQQEARLDSAEVMDHYGEFSDFLLRDFTFTVAGRVIAPDIVEYVMVDTGDLANVNVNLGQGVVSSLSMLTLCSLADLKQPEISETLVVISFYLTDVMPTDAIRIELTSAEFELPKGAAFRTKITDFRYGSPKVRAYEGPLFAPVVLGAGGRLDLYLYALFAILAAFINRRVRKPVDGSTRVGTRGSGGAGPTNHPPQSPPK